MNTSFTNYSDNSIWGISTEDNDATKALQYLNNPKNFRSFAEGLTELMCKYSYDGLNDGSDKSIEEKTDFIYQRLASIGVAPTKITVKDWFKGKRRPNTSKGISRTLMFQICFALGVKLEDVKWFFSHVYFDRSFNCHTIEDAVYYYCFLNQLDYTHAKKLLQSIDEFPIEKVSESSVVFTKDILRKLKHISSDEELLSFFRENKGIFFQWNQTAKKHIDKFLAELQNKEADKNFIKTVREKKELYLIPKLPDDCGLLLHELFHADNPDCLEDINYRNASSMDFMLYCMFHSTKKLHKDAPIPDIVRRNFPSKKVFSDILLSIDTSTSYDSIRKCLILLKFYQFHCSVKLYPELCKLSELFETYMDETNDLLTECGYEEIFSGNPYDWLFLWASSTDEPLGYFRAAMNQILEPDNE